MKGKLTLLILSLTILGLASCTDSSATLKVFMPTEYIDETLVEQFEEEKGVNVEIIAFESNEIAIPQVETSSYDLVIPSDYAIEELASKGLLETIDWSKLNTMDQTDLEPELLTFIESIQVDVNVEGFDMLSYAVPYFWGNVGLLYDSTKVSYDFLETNGWNSLNLVDDKVMFYDSSRDMIMVALKDLYGGAVDVNSPTEEQLEAAKEWLVSETQVSDSVYATDEIFDDMLEQGNTKYAMAVSYSGDAVYLMSENEDLGYFVPSSGTNVWLDAFVIPKNAKNKDLAYDFINFMSSYESMYQNSDYVGYTAPRKDVLEDIILDGYYSEQSYRVAIRPNDSIFRYNPESKQAIAELWALIRSS